MGESCGWGSDVEGEGLGGVVQVCVREGIGLPVQDRGRVVGPAELEGRAGGAHTSAYNTDSTNTMNHLIYIGHVHVSGGGGELSAGFNQITDLTTH